MSIKDYLHPLWKKSLELSNNPSKTNVLNNAILMAVNTELSATEQETIKSKMESYLDSATGEWLDFWGSWFGVKRKPSWNDEEYREHIKHHVIHARDTVQAIREALAEFLETNKSNIKIYEPYNDIFITNYSNLNGSAHLMGGYYYYCVIDIRISVPFDMGVADIINWFRPAGVIWLVTFDSGVSPDAEIIDMSPTNTEFFGHQADITYWQGFDKIINQTLTPSYSYGDTALSLFFTNQSELNGVDVLAGDAHGGRTSYNYVGYSHTLHDMSSITGVTDIMKNTIAVDEGQYQLLKSPDNNTLDITVSSKLYEGETTPNINKHYTYIALDLRNFFFDYFESKAEVDKAIGEANNDAKYNTYMGTYFNTANLDYRLKAYVSAINKVATTVKFYNFNIKSWVDYDNLTLENKFIDNRLKFTGGFESGLSKSGILVAVIASDTKDTDYTIGYDYAGLNLVHYYDNQNSINIYGNPDEVHQWGDLTYEGGNILDLDNMDKSELISHTQQGYPVRYLRNYIKNTTQPDLGRVTWSTVGLGTTDEQVPNMLVNTLENGDMTNGTRDWSVNKGTMSYNVTDYALDVSLQDGGSISVIDKALFPNTKYRVKAIITSRASTEKVLKGHMLVANSQVSKQHELTPITVTTGNRAEYDFGNFSTDGITPSVSTFTITSDTALDFQIKLVQVRLDFKLDVDGTEYDYAPFLYSEKAPIIFNTPLIFDKAVTDKVTFNDTLGSPKYTDIVIQTAPDMLTMGSRMSFTELLTNGMTYAKSLGKVEMKEHCLTVDLGKVFTDFTNITLHHGSDLSATSISYDSCLQTSTDGVHWYTWYDNYRDKDKIYDESYLEPSGRPVRFAINNYDTFNDNFMQEFTVGKNYITQQSEVDYVSDVSYVEPNKLLGTQEPKHSSKGTFHLLYQMDSRLEEEKLHAQFNIRALSGAGVNTFKLVLFDAKQVTYKAELDAGTKYEGRMGDTDSYANMLGVSSIPTDATQVAYTPLSGDYTFYQGSTEYDFIINLPQNLTYKSPVIAIVSSSTDVDFWVNNMKVAIGSNRTPYTR